MGEHCQEAGASARVGGIGGQVLGRGATAPPPPIAEHTRTLQRTADSEKPVIQMGDGKENRGATREREWELAVHRGNQRELAGWSPEPNHPLAWKSGAARACGASIYLVLRLGWLERPSRPPPLRKTIGLFS